MLTLAYLVMAVVGCLYIVVSAFLGHLTDFGDSGGHGGDGHAGDGGGHVGDGHGGDGHAGDGGGHYGVDGGGHGHAAASGGGGAAFHFPFFSPLAVATLFTAIGGWGLIARHVAGLEDAASMLVAIPTAFATAYGVTYGAWRLASSSRGSSVLTTARFVGASGEVITPIPEGGLGEVAAMVEGHRFTSSARERSGRPLARGTQVKILRLTGSTLLVEADTT